MALLELALIIKGDFSGRMGQVIVHRDNYYAVAIPNYKYCNSPSGAEFKCLREIMKFNEKDVLVYTLNGTEELPQELRKQFDIAGAKLKDRENTFHWDIKIAKRKVDLS